MAKDPVFGMSGNEETAMTSVHEGKTRYFCSARCKATFEKHPSRYRKA